MRCGYEVPVMMAKCHVTAVLLSINIPAIQLCTNKLEENHFLARILKRILAARFDV